MNFVINNHNILEILIVTYLVSFILVFLSKRLAIYVGAMDIPNARKIHKHPMPRLGGIAIYGGFLFGYMAYGEVTTQMLSILIASFILVVLGILDDIKPIRAKYKFLVHLVVASIVVFYGRLFFQNITLLGLNLYFPILLGQIISVLFIVSAINAINLIDGLDGLCAGVSSIYFATIAVIAFIMGNTSGLDVILCLIMLGSTLGFLTHNFPPAKVFMGDCGSTFLGFMISIIALLGFKVATITSLVVPLLILAIPIFDTLFAIIRRLIKHQSIGEPDKEHFHHQLLRMKFSPRVSLFIIYFISMLFSLVSIFYAIGNNSKLAIGIYIVLMILLIIIVAKTNILFEHKKKKKKEL